MARVYDWRCFALFFLVACGANEGRTGPALMPRPEAQTCLPDVSEGMPARLSETGCFEDLKTLEPGPDLVPYDVSSALWTDGAFKPRYMVVPSPAQVTVEEDGSWRFPEGSVLIKVFGFEFEVGDPESRRAVETRFMVRHQGQWEYATYRWNDEGTDGDLLDEGVTVDYTIRDGDQSTVIEYLFPGYDACTTCHGVSIDDVLGPKTGQMNRDLDYDGLVVNQLVAMDEIDLLDFGASDEIDPEAMAAMADPHDDSAALEDRARAYLDANCAHCHRPGGWAPSDTGLDLRYETTLERTGLCDPMKYFQWVGMPRLAPGDPEGSGVLQRFALQDPLRMPSLGTSVVDPFGTSLLSDWVSRMDRCP